LGQGKPNLLLRVISALVLAPVVLAAVWLGGIGFFALVLAAVAMMGWEWARLVARGGFGLTGALILAAGLAAVATVGMGGAVGWVLLVVLAGAALVLAAGFASGATEPAWAAGGSLWIALGTSAFLALDLRPGGRETVLWLLAIVWVNDTAAYAAGRSIGGPKLAPRLSPNKTWAGFVGGVAAAGVLGWLAASLAATSAASLVPVSLLLGIASQLGDLAESLAKRHFGVKDSSGLIPGHGGLLDRVDGLLAAAVMAAALTLIAGKSPLLW
jgi:phosphatidate cytidylyltransferase